MGAWLVRNPALVNVVLLVLTVMSYVSPMDWLMILTHWCSPDGAIGGVLEYQPFGSVAVFHVTRDNLKGPLWLAVPDVTAYLLFALAVINAVGLARSLQVRGSKSRPVRGLAIRNLLLTAGCLVTYIWGTMLYIARYLSLYPEVGGVVGYAIGFVISVTHVYQGPIESSLDTRTYEFTLWLLLLVLISTVITIRRQLSSNERKRRFHHVREVQKKAWSSPEIRTVCGETFGSGAAGIEAGMRNSDKLLSHVMESCSSPSPFRYSASGCIQQSSENGSGGDEHDRIRLSTAVACT